MLVVGQSRRSVGRISPRTNQSRRFAASFGCPTVVHKVIRSQATEFRYERSRQPLPRIDPWRDQLEGLLLENAGKPAPEQLPLIRIFEELRAVGYEGSYDAVRRYAKRWRAQRGAAMAEAFVPLSFAPGEAYQFDWSHEIVLINGVTVTVKVAHVRLCYSRMLFVRAYPRENSGDGVRRPQPRLCLPRCGIAPISPNGVTRFCRGPRSPYIARPAAPAHCVH